MYWSGLEHDFDSVLLRNTFISYYQVTIFRHKHYNVEMRLRLSQP